eukprot:TRINITY_DN18374_c0_g1_i1.p1 TRINITY_DN18374_c0_g1~~TRINITY_DN18374_c0_g1_i1.p1  ORF type:complete len:333 (-),score=62.92 TRINITY_DN18374_c0_g1_i1:162-1160(-)
MNPLHIIKQNSLSQEKFSKNGVHKIVHVVVKNTSFIIHLGLCKTNLREINFHRLILEAILLYDCDDFRFVDYVKISPIEFKTHTNETGDQCSVEMRIKVLTSQLEDMFFRIKFMAYDAITKMLVPSLVTITEPIKVISKPDQLKKKTPKSKKRTVSDLFVDTLSRIESQQIEQQKLLEKLSSKTEKLPHPNDIAISNQTLQIYNSKTTSQNHQNTPNNQNQHQDDFEKEFANLMTSYAHICEEDRASKIRKVIFHLTRPDSEQLKEILDLLWTEGLQRELRRDSRAGAMRHCSPLDCSYKKELDKIEEFYKEFLSSSYLNPNVNSMPTYLGY